MQDPATRLTRRAVLRAFTSGGALAASAALSWGCGPSPLAEAATAAPGTLIMIIRHGEKPDGKIKGVDENGKSDKHSLTRTGYARARALADLFDPAGGQPRRGLARPTTLYAAGATDDGEGKRTRQTLAPLAGRLGTTVNSQFGKGDEQSLAASVTARRGPTLICWQHGEIPAIAAAFGALSPTPPDSWPTDRFDMIWTLTAAGTGWRFAQVPEMVLPGDEAATFRG